MFSLQSLWQVVVSSLPIPSSRRLVFTAINRLLWTAPFECRSSAYLPGKARATATGFAHSHLVDVCLWPCGGGVVGKTSRTNDPRRLWRYTRVCVHVAKVAIDSSDEYVPE